jgi:hypothetical protein
MMTDTCKKLYHLVVKKKTYQIMPQEGMVKPGDVEQVLQMMGHVHDSN